jgi:hypothetical protein
LIIAITIIHYQNSKIFSRNLLIVFFLFSFVDLLFFLASKYEPALNIPDDSLITVNYYKIFRVIILIAFQSYNIALLIWKERSIVINKVIQTQSRPITL